MDLNAGSGDNHYVLQLQRSSPLVEGEKPEEANGKRPPVENGSTGPGIQLRAIGVPLELKAHLDLSERIILCKYPASHFCCNYDEAVKKCLFKKNERQVLQSQHRLSSRQRILCASRSTGLQAESKCEIFAQGKHQARVQDPYPDMAHLAELLMCSI